MKFTTTKNRKWRKGVGEYPAPWIEYKEFDVTGYGSWEYIEDDVYHNSIVKFYYSNIVHWDFDVCGNEIHDFLFEDGKAFRLEYSWWAEYHHENDDENGLKSEYYITEITKDEANVPNRTIRDWL